MRRAHTYIPTKNDSRQGFTLVELIIVVIVIGILAVLTVVGYNGVKQSAVDTSLKSDLENSAAQLAAELTDNGNYPGAASSANNGQGLNASSGNSLAYSLKPYGFCLQASNSSTTTTYIIRSDTKEIEEGICNASVATASGSGSNGTADGSAATAQFNCLETLAIDTAGNLYAGTDSNPGRIRKVTTDGTVSTYANLGDVSPYCPQPTAIDSAGTVYFTVSDIAHAHRIWKASSAGVVSLVAGTGVNGFLDGAAASAQFYNPGGMALDVSGNLYVADPSNDRIRKITPGGTVSTFAGGTSGYLDGTGTAARFDGPQSIAIDTYGNMYVADSYNDRIRKITVTGVVTTLAGSGTNGYLDGPGTTAQFSSPDSIAVDKSGVVYVSEYDGTRVRKIAPDGTVTTLAGTANYSYTNGLDTVAEFNSIGGIAVDSSGNVYVSDAGNRRIRKIVQ